MSQGPTNRNQRPRVTYRTTIKGPFDCGFLVLGVTFK